MSLNMRLTVPLAQFSLGDGLDRTASFDFIRADAPCKLWQAYNFSSFLNYNAMFVAIALGICFAIVTGESDLSVGSVAASTSVVAKYLSPNAVQVALPGAGLSLLGLGFWIWETP
jgi:ribose/xylose/arabinose/galactoside ABC-type transport system permease subunit